MKKGFMVTSASGVRGENDFSAPGVYVGNVRLNVVAQETDGGIQLSVNARVNTDDVIATLDNLTVGGDEAALRTVASDVEQMLLSRFDFDGFYQDLKDYEDNN